MRAFVSSVVPRGRPRSPRWPLLAAALAALCLPPLARAPRAATGSLVGAPAAPAAADTAALDFTLEPLEAVEAVAPAAAEQALPAAGVTDTIFVDAARDLRGAVPAGAALATRVPLEEARGGGDLGELLAAVAGLRVRRHGAAGAEALPSIRGGTAAQIAVLVDGVPLADAQDGVVDLASLPLERFAAADVYRGPAPAAFGGAGGAAAINLLTRAPGGGGAETRLFAGSWGDRGGRASLGWGDGGGRRGGLLLLHARRGDGDFAYRDHNQTFAEGDDDTVRTRANADFAEWGGWLTGRWDAGRLLAAASVGAFRRDGGRPGPLGYLSPRARTRHERQDATLAVATPGDALRLDATAARTLELLHDDAGEVGWDPPGTTRGLGHDLGGRLTARRATGLARLPGPWPGGRAELTAGADWRRQWYRETRAGATDPLRRRTTVTAFASLRLDLWGPRLTLAPAWRWQRLTDNFPPLPALPWLPETPLARPHVQDAVAPSAGVVWEARPARFFLEAHAARFPRVPTWVELFGHRGGIDGNRGLRPEQVESWDVGARWRAPGGALWTRLALFRSDSDRTVLFVQSSQRTSRAVNFGRARVSGLEWEAAGELGGGWRASANVTWQEARDRGDDPAYRGRRLPFQPACEASLATGWRGANWDLGATLTAISAAYRDRYNSAVERAPARALVGLSAARAWRAGPARLTATAEVVNLTDDDVYDVEGFPLPGRAFRLSLAAR